MRFSLGYFPVVVGAAVGVGVADLGNGGHVDGVVHAPVAAQGQPVDLAVAGGRPRPGRCRCRRRSGRGWGTGDVAGVADDGPGVDRADPEDSRSRWCPMRGPPQRVSSWSARAGCPGGAGLPGTGRPGRGGRSRSGPQVVILSSTEVARPAVISFLTPPGTRSQITAWRRQATWFRARARSRCRLAQIFSTAP